MPRLILITFLAFTAILTVSIPAVTLAVAPSQTQPYKDAYVPCGTDDVNKDNIVDNPCGFKDVVELGKRLILGCIAAGVIFAALGFSYAGYLYITAMGSQEKISHAHSIFTKTFLGFVFMLSAWLIVKALEGEFLTDAYKQKSMLLDRPATSPGGGNPGSANPGGGGAGPGAEPGGANPARSTDPGGGN